jgi:hypothetical protein
MKQEEQRCAGRVTRKQPAAVPRWH